MKEEKIEYEIRCALKYSLIISNYLISVTDFLRIYLNDCVCVTV